MFCGESLRGTVQATLDLQIGWIFSTAHRRRDTRLWKRSRVGIQAAQALADHGRRITSNLRSQEWISIGAKRPAS